MYNYGQHGYWYPWYCCYPASYRYYPSGYYLVRHRSFRQPDELDIPDTAKTKKVIPIGDEFFVPEFKIASCNTSRLSYFYGARRFKISMNRAKRAFRSATERVKATARKWNEEINKFLGDNSAEIRRVENEIRNRWAILAAWDCPPNQIETTSHCQQTEPQRIYAEIKALERRLRDLKSKRSGWESLAKARDTFQNNLKQMATEQIPNVSWPKSWPTLEEMEHLPVLVSQELDFPKTLKDINIDSGLIQEIPLPGNIDKMIHIPEDIQAEFNWDTVKDQIQFDDLTHTAVQVLSDLKNQALSELEKYNMCFFIKNSPYTLEIQLEYVSNFRKLVENYVYGCIEKAKNAALLVFFGYIPSIINTYGATIGIALTNAFSTFWTTLKKCLFDVYNKFKQDIENITDAKDFGAFLEAIEKYVSIDITLEKRTVPWDNKGSLVDLVSNRFNALFARDLPFTIPPGEEYTQSDPQISMPIQDFVLDTESLKKIIDKCAKHGMWIFAVLNQKDVFGNWVGLWLNVRSFKNDVLTGYNITRIPEGKLKNNMEIPLGNIRNLQCYDPSTDSTDNPQDLITKHYIINPCSPDFKGIFFGKGFIDVGKDVYIYYEIYECGVKTGIYIDGALKYEQYIPRFGLQVEHVYDHPLTPTHSYKIALDITKKDGELQQRLRVWFYENVLDDMVQLHFWKMKLPW